MREFVEASRTKVAAEMSGPMIGDVGSVNLTLPPVLLKGRWNSVVIDSREVLPGDLFVALPGENADGHRFVADALARGAAGALVRRNWAQAEAAAITTAVVIEHQDLIPSSPVLIAVADPLATLQAWAAHHRACYELPVIGITGSVGKTSTKELLAAVLAQHLTTLANVKSFNNEIGVPLTLLKLRPEHQAAVLEIGTYGPGEIAALCKLARPGLGIVTNVGPSHLERMGTVETVARAKRELVEELPPDGLALLNGDDPRVRQMRDATAARVLLFGIGQENDLRAGEIDTLGLDGVAFTAYMEGEQRRLHTSLLGRHSVYTALAAVGVARELGVPWPAIEAGLHEGKARVRIVVRQAANGVTVLDDTYNASPVSCQAALDLLAEMSGRRIAVFGDMAELGPEEVPGHRAVGRAAAGVVDMLVVVGAKARWIGEAALEAERPPEVLFAASNAEAVERLRERLLPGDYVLVKGARVATTEKIVAALEDEKGR